MNITEKAKHIKLLILDVDGVMTDGKVIYSDSGEELKFFNTSDGHGLRLLMRAGINVAIVTGRTSRAVEHRAADLGIKILFQKALIKIEAYEKILMSEKLIDREICAVGDDLPDLPVLRKCGLSFAVQNCVEELKSEVDYITEQCGGNGAVREICEIILKAQGLWKKVTARYYL
jgi:3-deoxy-D-manno-octulosonate 8-phosphate phosphatase (KDO 8-P phosphatase)